MFPPFVSNAFKNEDHLLKNDHSCHLHHTYCWIGLFHLLFYCLHSQQLGWRQGALFDAFSLSTKNVKQCDTPRISWIIAQCWHIQTHVFKFVEHKGFYIVSHWFSGHIVQRFASYFLQPWPHKTVIFIGVCRVEWRHCEKLAWANDRGRWKRSKTNQSRKGNLKQKHNVGLKHISSTPPPAKQLNPPLEESGKGGRGLSSPFPHIGLLQCRQLIEFWPSIIS